LVVHEVGAVEEKLDVEVARDAVERAVDARQLQGTPANASSSTGERSSSRGVSHRFWLGAYFVCVEIRS
jgi:hypothetical protein